MPAKNRIKKYVENGYYHIYNRGVEKRIIFTDEQDYAVLLSYLKTYLTPKDTPSLQNILASNSANSKEKAKAIKLLRMNNFFEHLNLLAFCLMPNHFHFLVNQREPEIIDKFMNSLGTRYSMYFNRKHNRVGPLFQGLYKAVLITSEEQLLYVSRYIHRNPISKGPAFNNKYSSYPDFLGVRKTSWIKTNEILSYFSKTGFSSYRSFVEDQLHDEVSYPILKDLKLEYEN